MLQGFGQRTREQTHPWEQRFCPAPFLQHTFCPSAQPALPRVPGPGHTELARPLPLPRRAPHPAIHQLREPICVRHARGMRGKRAQMGAIKSALGRPRCATPRKHRRSTIKPGSGREAPPRSPCCFLPPDLVPQFPVSPVSACPASRRGLHYPLFVAWAAIAAKMNHLGMRSVLPRHPPNSHWPRSSRSCR